jgi:hypothetical protein
MWMEQGLLFINSFQRNIFRIKINTKITQDILKPLDTWLMLFLLFLAQIKSLIAERTQNTTNPAKTFDMIGWKHGFNNLVGEVKNIYVINHVTWWLSKRKSVVTKKSHFKGLHWNLTMDGETTTSNGWRSSSDSPSLKLSSSTLPIA